jgi:cytochrome c556
MKMKTDHALAAAVVAVITLGTLAVAASSTETIKDRQAAMESIGDALGNLVAIAKGEAPFDAEVVHDKAATIADHLQMASSLFPEGSHAGDVETWAKPEIWANHADFVEKLEAAQAAAKSLGSVSEEAAFRPAFGKLGNACKSCHQTYRRPKN